MLQLWGVMLHPPDGQALLPTPLLLSALELAEPPSLEVLKKHVDRVLWDLV